MQRLTMTFQPGTIQHLGVKMYSTVPPALAELIANAYDAGATKTKINLIDRGEKRIIVSDDGIGMTFDEINSYFLRIGRNRREELQPSVRGRQPTGKKGLGKLALFGLGERIEIITSKNNQTTIFKLDWNDILNCPTTNYEPKFEIRETHKNERGTSITLTKLKRITGFPYDTYIESLAKLFDFGDNFKVAISLNGENEKIIDNRTKFNTILPEFEWSIEEVIRNVQNQYNYDEQIMGKIITTKKPLKTNLRGIILYANGRLINAPEFFVKSDSSHFYSYVTGWLNVDFLDNFEEDLISTNRQSINWEHPKAAELREFLQACILQIEKEWRERRKEEKRNSIREKSKIDVAAWYSTLPQKIQNNVEAIVNTIDDLPELSEATLQKTIESLYSLVPEYALYHWRYLHSSIKDASYDDYKKTDYYRAIEEAIKRYEVVTKEKSAIHNKSGVDLMMNAFGIQKKLNVTSKYKKVDGSEFSGRTKQNIEDGQRFMSAGLMAGVRNPIAHEEKKQLKESGLFTEKDCLDMLSMLSHLFRRLDDV